MKSKFQHRLEAALQKNEEMKTKKQSKFKRGLSDALDQDSSPTLEDIVNGRKKVENYKENLKKAFVTGVAMGYHNLEESEKLFEEWYKNNIE